jgi:hypothetical protein
MPERRKTRRYRPNQKLLGRVRTTVPARIIDLSETGAKIEVDSSYGPSAVLRPNTTCDLWLPRSGDDPLRLPAKVRYCRAVGVGKNEDGTSGMLYRSGLEFRFEDEVSRTALKAHIEGHLPPQVRRDDGGSDAPRRERVRVRVNIDDVRRRLEEEKK